MKPDHESLPLLRRLHERVFTHPDVRAVLEAGFARLEAKLETRPEPPHSTCAVPIELFVDDARHDEVRLCRLFLLRRGARMAVPERHRNSVQRLVSYRGRGSIHQGIPGGGPEGLRTRAVFSPDADTADLDRHWDIVLEGVWHFPEAAEDEDWATVTFHSATEDEIVDESWTYGMESCVGGTHATEEARVALGRTGPTERPEKDARGHRRGLPPARELSTVPAKSSHTRPQFG